MRLLRWIRFVWRGDFPQRWQDRVFQGHVSFGPVTIYGANAMHWAINVWWRGEYWCFHPTTRTFGGRWPWYFYVSRDATPHGARVLYGPGHAREYGRKPFASAAPARTPEGEA
jgi:hypothetical protein